MSHVRIIGGQWKRRVIKFIPLEGLRPTPDRVRETLFNWLMWDIAGRVVVDACAGSGALGLEALSRGAGFAYLIEPEPEQAAQLRQNLALLAPEQPVQTRAMILSTTAQQAIASITRPIDGLFLDPPFNLNLWEPLAQLFLPKLAPNAWIYVEAPQVLEMLNLPLSWTLQKQTRAGQVHAGLYRMQS